MANGIQTGAWTTVDGVKGVFISAEDAAKLEQGILQFVTKKEGLGQGDEFTQNLRKVRGWFLQPEPDTQNQDTKAVASAPAQTSVEVAKSNGLNVTQPAIPTLAATGKIEDSK